MSEAYFFIESGNSGSPSTAYANIRDKWAQYCRINAAEWAKIYTAWTAEYNPIENYDRSEESTTTSTGDNKLTHDSDEITTSSVDVSVTNANGTGNNIPTSTNYVYTDNENDPARAESYSTTTGIVTTTTQAEADNNKTTKQLADNTTTHNNTDTFTSRIHGNIGVTTNATMIKEELEMRFNNNMVQIIVGGFMSKYSFYV